MEIVYLLPATCSSSSSSWRLLVFTHRLSQPPIPGTKLQQPCCPLCQWLHWELFLLLHTQAVDIVFFHTFSSVDSFTSSHISFISLTVSKMRIVSKTRWPLHLPLKARHQGAWCSGIESLYDPLIHALENCCSSWLEKFNIDITNICLRKCTYVYFGAITYVVCKYMFFGKHKGHLRSTYAKK